MEEVESRLPAERARHGLAQRSVSFRVLKEGREVDVIALSERAYSVFGRSPEMAHHVLDHQSISRRHAVIFFSFDERQTFIMDLNASHHTYVNAKELEPFKATSLKAGDAVMFGKSTRIYELLESSKARPLPSVPLFNTEGAVANAPPAAAPVAAPVSAPVAAAAAASVRDRGEERAEREREIARMTAEMTGGASIPSRPQAGPALETTTLSEMAAKYGIASEEQADEDNEDDDDEGWQMQGAAAKAAEAEAEAVAEAEAKVGNGDGDAVESFARTHKVPVSHQVDLGGFSKAVTCLSVEPSGGRVLGGSLDFSLKLFDFGGMDTRHAAFRSLVPEAGHAVVALTHSPSGDRVLVATSGSQPRVLDREGKEVLRFVRGDMYLRDQSNTKGHTMEAACVAWHPADKNLVLSGSLDGTLRLWDLAGALALGQLVNKAVLKIRTAPGAPQGRLAVTACCFSFDGKKIVAGCADGSLHIWAPPMLTRTQALLRPAFGAGVAVTSIATSGTAGGVAGGVLAARGADGSVQVWALSALVPSGSLQQQQAQLAAPAPLWRMQGLESSSAAANIDFSPDGSLLVAAASAAPAMQQQQQQSASATARLCFFKLEQPGAADAPCSPCLQISIAGAGASFVKWVASTNQIFVGTTAGSIRVFFDPQLSTKGAVLSAGRAPARPKDPQDFAVVGQIFNPHALPMYRDDESGLGHKAMSKKKPPAELDLKAGGMAPAKAPAGPLVRENASFKFTQMMAAKKVRYLSLSPLLSLH